MFNSLITAMSLKEENRDGIHEVNDNLSKIVAKYQLATTELIAYSSEMVHGMEKDKDEIKRLNALIDIQKKILFNYQDRIEDMQEEIARLKGRIQEAENTEHRREAMYEKITELQKLAGPEHLDTKFSYPYISN